MTAAPTHDRVQVVDAALAPRVEAFLEGPSSGSGRTEAILRHQQLLDALDRGEYRRLAVWPDDDPAAVAHLAASGTLTVSGSADAGDHLGSYLAGSGWRVLLGDVELAQAIIDVTPKGLRRRGISAREQRFMHTTGPPPLDPPAGFRLAARGDLGVVTDFACRLHVEDQMGPPLSRGARTGVADRMRSSISRSLTWVVERQGEVVAKFDVSLWTRRRGAQIAGVFVDEGWRGQGIAAKGVAAVAGVLIADGLPGVTLHVRSDNAAGRRAYANAGFVDGGPWILALR
jgi:uncharacterized protein